jgi:glutaminyl-tRNA synthetase
MDMTEKSSNFIHDVIDADIAHGNKEVYTRFPPEPNGYLHIGHAKSICLNFGTAKKYGGKCNLRFDDTNPVKEDVEYVDSIMEDIRWMGFTWDKLAYASGYFDELYAIAVKLIENGLAYVCDLTADEIRRYRGTLSEPGSDSPYRGRSAEENLRLFEDMRAGKYPEGGKVLRAKIDMASPNINLRDPVLYRILFKSHHRTGDKWCIYPMYDYTHPASDALEGITHSICTMEFEDHRPLYDWVINNGGFAHKPKQIEFARLNLTDTVMSKRYLKKLVDDGAVSGWDDPRMPTLCGMRKKGYPAAAIREFCERIGVAKANSEVDAGLLQFCVRNELNRTAERAMAVFDPLRVVLTNYPEDKAEDAGFDINPNDIAAGRRSVAFSRELYIEREDFSLNPPPKYFRLVKGGLVRLKGAYIIRCDEAELSRDGEPETLYCSYVENSKSGADESGLKVKGVIHWANARCAAEMRFKRYESLLDPSKPEGEFAERLNPDSETVGSGAYAEPYIAESPDGTSFQLMRKGYYVKDGDTLREIAGLKDSFTTKA